MSRLSGRWSLEERGRDTTAASARGETGRLRVRYRRRTLGAMEDSGVGKCGRATRETSPDPVEQEEHWATLGSVQVGAHHRTGSGAHVVIVMTCDYGGTLNACAKVLDAGAGYQYVTFGGPKRVATGLTNDSGTGRRDRHQRIRQKWTAVIGRKESGLAIWTSLRETSYRHRTWRLSSTIGHALIRAMRGGKDSITIEGGDQGPRREEQRLSVERSGVTSSESRVALPRQPRASTSPAGRKVLIPAREGEDSTIVWRHSDKYDWSKHRSSERLVHDQRLVPWSKVIRDSRLFGRLMTTIHSTHDRRLSICKKGLRRARAAALSSSDDQGRGEETLHPEVKGKIEEALSEYERRVVTILLSRSRNRRKRILQRGVPQGG